METKTKVIPLRKMLPIAKPEKALHATKKENSQSNKVETVNIDRILYLRFDSIYTVIHLADGTKIVSSTTLKKYADKLGSERFLQVHPSYLINKSSISCYMANQNKVVLHNSQEIPVSNSKKEGLITYLKTLMV